MKPRRTILRTATTAISTDAQCEEKSQEKLDVQQDTAQLNRLRTSGRVDGLVQSRS